MHNIAAALWIALNHDYSFIGAGIKAGCIQISSLFWSPSDNAIALKALAKVKDFKSMFPKELY